jgi:membrane-bound ClpP family serine protease
VSRFIHEIGVLSTVFLGIIGVGFVLMVTGAIIFIANCADWTGRACTEQIGWVPQFLVDIPLTLIGFAIFFGGIAVLIIYRSSQSARKAK